MSKFFTRERFGQPQIFAGLLLLLFLVQCLWLASRPNRYRGGNDAEVARVETGLALWGKEPQKNIMPSELTHEFLQQPALAAPDGSLAQDRDHSALWYLISAAPFLFCRTADMPGCLTSHLWLAIVPNLLFAILLGASLWYVARRLYGNSGGYIALIFYCFSPGIIVSSAMWFAQPEMGAAWGAFGAIFTAIAVSHTLYAPREVVLWNWRRILLLGLSFALGVGSQFSLIILLPIALLFMLYLAPGRRRAALTIWLSACIIAFGLLFAAYGFHPTKLLAALRNANFLGLVWQAFTVVEAYLALFRHLVRIGPGVVAILPVALIAYAYWRRARYFGNTAPLIVAALLLILSLASPHYPGFGFALMAVPFLFVFISGVIADLLETNHRALVLLSVSGVLLVNACVNLWLVMHAM
ncbi:MAG TPA: hypothetical protein VGG46_10095 [Terriglobales bacterium]|jgi:hypothetical protein